MKLHEALQDVLGSEFDVPSMIADLQVSSEFIVALALTAVDTQKLDTQAARELLAWDERRRSAEAA